MTGLLAWVLDDEDRTRRARSLLYPIAIILLIVGAIVVHSPLAGAVIGVPAAITALVTWRRSVAAEGLGKPPGSAVAGDLGVE